MTKKPFVTKEQLEEIAKVYPTPFHIYDERGIRENVRALKEAFFLGIRDIKNILRSRQHLIHF